MSSVVAMNFVSPLVPCPLEVLAPQSLSRGFTHKHGGMSWRWADLS